MKHCSGCKTFKPFNNFYACSRSKDGKRAECKECVTAYTRTEHGMVNVMYSRMKSRSKLRLKLPFTLNKEDFIDFLNDVGAFDLYDKWVASNFDKDLHPSVDRKDDYKGYTLDNIRIVTLKENIDRYYTDAKQGVNTKTARAIHQYDLEGNLVKTYHSISEAARSVGAVPSNIRIAALNTPIKRKNKDGTYRYETRKVCKGFLWKFEE